MRPARLDDCAEIAKLFLISSDGLAEYIWSQVDIPGLSLIEIGNQGHGTRLLEAAQERARSLGLPRVSLICFEHNEAAMRLYRRFGYRETDRRTIVPHPTLYYRDGDAVLLVRTVD